MFFKEKNHVSHISNEAFKQLARNNVRRSIKNYLIYFITLSFGAVLLYSFNSIDDILSNLLGNYLLDSYIYMTKGILAIFAIIICLVFGFLIAYSNNFLMKKRKREFGIYITLGMDKKNITKIMFKENIIIGFLSLCIGLILGIFISQGLGIIVFKMMNFPYKFSLFISISAIVKTVVLFIFVLFIVNVLNKRTIKKYKLIDLIYSNKKNENFSSDNNTTKNFITLFISILLMLVAYILLKSMHEVKVKVIVIAIALLVVSTYLFFLSISDFVLKQIRKRKKLYYNNLTMFVVSQISSRIKSISLVITIICLIIFSALTIIPFGMSLGNYFKQDIGVSTPFGTTIMRYNIGNDSYNEESIYSDNKDLINKKYESLEKGFKNNSSYNDLVSSSVEVNTYRLKDVTLNKIFNNIPKDDNYDIEIMSVADYNNVREKQGLQPINLKNNEFALNINNPDDKELLNLKKDLTLDVNNNNLKYSDTYFNVYCYNNNVVSSTNVSVVVPDDIVSNLYPILTYLDVYYIKHNNEYENNFLNKVFFNYKDMSNDNISFDSKLVIDGENIAFNIIFSFIAIYLGIILLISAGAILALQQVSSISTNKENFHILRKLGVEEKNIKKCMFIENLIFFVMPLLLAMFNFMIVYNVLYGIILELSKTGLYTNIFISSIIVIIIYGSYFFISYYESINSISKN